MNASGSQPAELSDVYYVAMLRFLGCTADAHETALLTGDDIAFRAGVTPVFGAPVPEFMRGVVARLGAAAAATPSSAGTAP